MGWAGRVNAWVCGRGQAANSDWVLEVPGRGGREGEATSAGGSCHTLPGPPGPLRM